MTTLVAFPMPDIVITGPADNVAIPTDNPENILGFTTLVDGRPVATRIEQRFLADGLDCTGLLRGLGVPPAPHLPGTTKALDRLPDSARQQLLKVGLVEVEEYDSGDGMKKHLDPRWILQTTHYWEQTFPSRHELVIEHRHKPSVGTSLGTEAERTEYRKRYCIDQDLLQTLRGAGPRDSLPFSEQRIEHILTTGANWRGPIPEFRLVVDKGDARNLVSLCGDSAKKISPTQFEIRKSSFSPDRNLYVLILEHKSVHR